MVNSDLVLELYKIMSGNLETFPNVFSALLRGHTLELVESAADAISSIEGETDAKRKRYLFEHLHDLSGRINDKLEFLAYFRDVPLGRSEGNVVRVEDIRIALEDEVSWLEGVCDEVRSEEDFETAKNLARQTAEDAYTTLAELDEGLAIDWLSLSGVEEESEPRADLELE